jgi:hypothetical protein
VGTAVSIESVAIKEFHGDEGTALVFANFIDGANVGVIEGGSGLGFAFETKKGFGVGGEIIGQKFESNEAVKLGVFGFIDDTHTTATKFFDDAIVSDGLAEHIDGKSYGILWRGKRQVNVKGGRRGKRRDGSQVSFGKYG